MGAPWDRRTPDERAAATQERLAAWLPGAVTHAPHWADVAARHGLQPDELTSGGDLSRFPTSLQRDLDSGGGAALVQRPTAAQARAVVPRSTRERLGRLLLGDTRDAVERLVLDEFKPVHVTHGALDRRLVVASSRADMRRMHDVGARAAQLLGLDDRDHLVSAVPAGPSDDFWAVRSLGMGAAMLGLHPRGHGDGLERCVDAFAVVPATAVACVPGDAVAWAELLDEADADVSRVVLVLLVGPPAEDPGLRDEVTDAWRRAGALEHEFAVRHLWSPDVHRSIWVECREGGDGLHTMPDAEVLEVLDPVDGRATDGHGDLTLTTMGWAGTTLLRYRTGDAVTLDPDPCDACGRTVPRIAGAVRPTAWQLPLAGRDGRTWLDGRAVAPVVEAAGVSEWRIVVRSNGATGDHVVVELAGGSADAVDGGLERRLATRAGVRPSQLVVREDPDALRREVQAHGWLVDQR